MSFDYFVSVHNDKWPTAKAVQTALERLGYPVSLASAPDEAFFIPKRTFSLPVIFEGRPVVIEEPTLHKRLTPTTLSPYGAILPSALLRTSQSRMVITFSL